MPATSTCTILGIDPGTMKTGYGLLQQERQHISVLHYGVLDLQPYQAPARKLQQIGQRIQALVETYQPDVVALEAPFYGKNVQAMLKLGRAQGVAMAAALVREVPIVEYAPRKIKQVVTGHGNASKEQVGYMVAKLLQLPQIPHPLDAADALAVALCHLYQGNIKQTTGSSWAKFIQQNPDRVH